MPSLKEVKNRIKSVQSTQQITKAMKMVAASKLRKAQDAIMQMRPYAYKLGSILQNIASGTPDDVQNPYAEQREVDKILLVVVTSDRGLCGAFNTNVIKKTVQVIENEYSDARQLGNLWILPVGKKGTEYFSKRKYQVIKDYSELFTELNYEASTKASSWVMDSFVNKKFDRVEIIYNEFKNVATQILQVEQFLPIPVVENEGGKAEEKDYIFEPSIAYIFEELIPQSLKLRFFKALLESNASEHGARMTAMDQATDNAGELLKQLRLTYNRSRQAAITKEILEIVGGAEALSQSS